MTVVVNTKATPFVYDEEGHVIPAYAWGDVENSERVEDGLRSGRLMKLDRPETAEKPKLTAATPPEPVSPAGETITVVDTFDSVPESVKVEEK